jgi:hypothetical protein
MVPACDFAVVPDVIDGTEADNDALLTEWPLGRFFGAPVWHMHETLERLERMASDWPRLCIGSSGGLRHSWEALHGGTESPAGHGRGLRRPGRPGVRLHGLRMLNPEVFSRLPFASADSTNIGRNIGIDQAWRGTTPRPRKRPAPLSCVRASNPRTRLRPGHPCRQSRKLNKECCFEHLPLHIRGRVATANRSSTAWLCSTKTRCWWSTSRQLALCTAKATKKTLLLICMRALAEL